MRESASFLRPWCILIMFDSRPGRRHAGELDQAVIVLSSFLVPPKMLEVAVTKRLTMRHVATILQGVSWKVSSARCCSFCTRFCT